jgi:hypothetical protein
MTTETKADFGTATQIVLVKQGKLVRYSKVNTPEVRKMGVPEIRSLQECLIRMALGLERVVTEKAPSKGRTYKTIPLRDLTLGLTESDDSYEGDNTFAAALMVGLAKAVDDGTLGEDEPYEADGDDILQAMSLFSDYDDDGDEP